MMVVIFAIKKWRPYLIEQQLRILTYHQTLCYFSDHRITTPMQFHSSFLESFVKILGTKLHHSSAYHPQFDGQTEVEN